MLEHHMRYDIYVGKTLYLSTLSVTEAFTKLRRWLGKGLSVNLEFVRL